MIQRGYMKNLSGRTRLAVEREYRGKFHLPVCWFEPDGGASRWNKRKLAEPFSRPLIRKALGDAIQESVRWGEPYVFFLAPGIVSWIVPVVQDEVLHGGLLGGVVVPEGDSDATSRDDSVAYLKAAGCKRGPAHRFVAALPAWPQARTREAAQFLFDTFYQISGWKPSLLSRNRENAQQQRQIAEEIHQRKVADARAYPYDEERALLSLIRVGDKKGCRRVLNKLLAAMFLYSPKLSVVRARAIEMMGYLVRAAVEDSPMLEPLIEQNQAWMARIAAAEDFDILCEALRDALDHFMDSIFLQGYNRTNEPVRKAIEYLSRNHGECVMLADVARHVGLSSFRIAHLVKEFTGRSIMQHVKRLRVQRARGLLDQSAMSGAEIAAATGFLDQSHFIKQFRELTGVTPARYRRERRAIG